LEYILCEEPAGQLERVVYENSKVFQDDWALLLEMIVQRAFRRGLCLTLFVWSRTPGTPALRQEITSTLVVLQAEGWRVARVF
jgi:hypothetical protein